MYRVTTSARRINGTTLFMFTVYFEETPVAISEAIYGSKGLAEQHAQQFIDLNKHARGYQQITLRGTPA